MQVPCGVDTEVQEEGTLRAAQETVGYYVTTAGLDEETVRDYIRKQEDEDKKLDQLKMFDE